jgi:hypothetical protein
MGSKMLFLLGIVAAHSAIAAALVQHETPGARIATATACVNTPDSVMPDFAPRAEIYAAITRAEYPGEVLQP